MLNAQSPKYPGLYDPESGVRFRHGRAEVTEEQARALARRRFVDGILIENIPAKRWVQQRDGAEDESESAYQAQPETPTITEPAVEKRANTRKAT